MALVLNITYSANNSIDEYDEMVIDDSTGSTEATEYGVGGNPTRVSLGLVLLTEKKGYGNIADAEITYSNAANTLTTIATWTVAIAADGWFLNTVLAFPEWLVGETYDVLQAVSYNDVVYTSIAGGNIGNAVTDGTKWLVADQDKLILIRDTVATYSTSHTIYTGVLSKIITGLGDIGYGDAVSSDLSKDCAAECYDDINETNKIWAYLEGAKISGARAKYMEGERKVLIYTDLIAGKDCKIC
jgi:hypothetical protein